MLSYNLGIAQNSILWEISGNKLSSSSYLMGTLKFIGEKEFYLPEEVTDRLTSCKIFAIEDQIDHKAQHELNAALHFPKGQSLSTQLKPEEYSQVIQFFKKEFGISKATFEKKYSKMIPLALSITMTRLSLDENLKYYDIELLKFAKKNLIEAYSLESAEREAEAIRSFPMQDQIKALLHSIDNFEKQKQEFHALEIAYIQSDLDKVFEYTLHPTENNPAFIEEFYTKRNTELLPKIERMIHEGASFIAIGVAHLEGEKGLLSLLQSKGYTVSPIPIKK